MTALRIIVAILVLWCAGFWVGMASFVWTMSKAHADMDSPQNVARKYRK